MELRRWREMDAACVLQRLSDHAKQDSTFQPLKDRSSSRWHASVRGAEFELLLTGTKFFDTRQNKGGGGAIDLAMHVLRADFHTAANHLRAKQI